MTASLELPQAVGSLDLALTDVSGRAVWHTSNTGPGTGEQPFILEGLAGLAPGIYFLNVFLDGIPLKPVKIIKGE